MTINWQDVFTILGGQTVFLAVAAYLFKQIVSTRLKFEADTEIERLRNALQITSLEHEIRYARLHERRAEVIAELYKLLQETCWTAQAFALIHARDRDHARVAREKVTELYRFIELHKLYFSTQVCGLLEQIEGKLRHSVVHVGVYFAEIECPTPEMRKEQNEVMLATYQELQTDIPAALTVLREEFRAILGVENGAAKAS
jgi:hypothetical protein